MTPMQYWKIEGEIEYLWEIPPSDKYIRNLQWHCPSCGKIWARAIFLGRLQQKRKWDVVSQHPCTTCGEGALLDHYTLTRLDTVPVPIEIYERELLNELYLYNKRAPIQ